MCTYLVAVDKFQLHKAYSTILEIEFKRSQRTCTHDRVDPGEPNESTIIQEHHLTRGNLFKYGTTQAKN
jgi:hypothetical protein